MLKFLAEKMWVAFAVQKLLNFFSAKNIRILYIESAKTVNKMTLNELVKLTMLRTTGPSSSTSYCTYPKIWQVAVNFQPQRVKTTWKKFKELLPVLSSCHLSFKTRGRVYSSCVRSAMLHASETWPLTKPNLQHLQRNDRAMIRQICNIGPQVIVTTRSSELLARLGIEDLDLILKERRLCWYGHVECSNGAVKTAFHIQVEVKHGPGRPKMIWKQLTERDCREALGYQSSW